mgnify:FL=1|tara:strand:+ start:6060 stop:6365 length:306 start_codon:yes stop_codon:yes gene_type:complete
MFIWIVVVVVLVAFWVYNWAELGGRLQGRNFWLLLGWSVAAPVAWQVAVDTLRLNAIVSFLILLLVLIAGYYQLRRNNPKPKQARRQKKDHVKTHRPKKQR